MKRLIVKYSIEFFVIVFSISISFFIDNLREDYERDELRKVIKLSLLDELKASKEYLDWRKKAFDSDLNAMEVISSDSSSIDDIFSNISGAGFSNPLLTPRTFNPPSSVYNSLVNDGTINLIKSRKIKLFLESTYVSYTKYMQDWISAESNISASIENYIMDNYPKYYLKDIYTRTDRNIVQEFKNIMDSDIKLKAYLKSKSDPMRVKTEVFDLYLKSRDSLIYYLESSLQN